MEQNKGSENRNLLSDVTPSSIVDEAESFDNDKTVGYPSSSSSFSSSSHLEIDIGEYDTTFPEFEENDSSLERSNPESPTVMIIASPLAPGVSLSPKQSPPIQVMGNDPSRNPSPVFGRKRRSDSEWSLASNESLFSIHMGNNSFSTDNGFYLSKSGELNWLDDELNNSCFTPEDSKSAVLQTVTETAESEPKSASTNRESGEKEAFLETQNDSTHNSANIACLSDASCQSDSSFAFPM